MYPITEINQHINNIELLIKHHNSSLKYIRLNQSELFKSLFSARSKETKSIVAYLQELIDSLSTIEKSRELDILINNLQIFFNFKQSLLREELLAKGLSLDKVPFLLSRTTTASKFDFNHPDNSLKSKAISEDYFIPIQIKDNKYTSPDDDKAHQHGMEAARIFFSTQWERFKGFCNWLLSKINIYVFETAAYEEHNYVDTVIYANDLAVTPTATNLKASHYWVGHATNFFVIPTQNGPLHLLTDPVEGDLNALLYPRKTEEANLVDGAHEKKLPKVDVILISHNHHDHLCLSTLALFVPQQPLMIVPEGDEQLFKDLGFLHVQTLKWWEQVQVNQNGNEAIRVTAVPARHWSGRKGPVDAHGSAFNGYVVQGNGLPGDIYFAGDTALMDESLSKPIFEQFNIVTSIQPGGPDERRADMESTHQSSADGILMHFKILKAEYDKLDEKTVGNFLAANLGKKTIFNHTSTFKLGNLRLRDTYFSMQRLVAAFREEWRKKRLLPFELKVYEEIKGLVNSMVMKDGQVLADEKIADLILAQIIMPKIGQRQQLIQSFNEAPEAFEYRNLITNKRALVEYDALTNAYLNDLNVLFEPKDLIVKLIEAYQNPWHASLTRKGIDGQTIERIKNAHDNTELKTILVDIESTISDLNPHGHLQSLLDYSHWLLQKDVASLRTFFQCKEIKELIHEQSHDSGRFFIGEGRQEKQKVFKDLAFKLARKPKTIEAYQKTITKWKQSVEPLLSENRSVFFPVDKTDSELAVEKIERVLGY